MEYTDVSPDFRWNKSDLQTIKKIMPHEATPEAVKVFSRYAYRLTDYGYWFLLSTLWVSDPRGGDLDEWRSLFLSPRSNRETSIMKPSELKVWRLMDNDLMLYRAHKPAENDWISYSILGEKAAEFACRYGVDKVSEYRVAKEDVLCLFLRGGEFEVLVLDRSKVEFIRDIPVVVEKDSGR